MKRKRSFNVSKDMYPWLCNIFARDGQKYQTGYKKDGYIVSLDVTGMRFHEFMEDALCEKTMTERYGLSADQVFDLKKGKSVGIPIVSKKTANDPEKLGRLLRYYGHNSYQVYTPAS